MDEKQAFLMNKCSKSTDTVKQKCSKNIFDSFRNAAITDVVLHFGGF